MGMKEKGEKLKEARVALHQKMSSKITYLFVIALVVPIAFTIIYATNNAVSTLKKTYMSYGMNLAEEAASGIDFAVELGENTYGRYAQNLAEETARSIDLVGGYEDNMSVDILTKIMGDVDIDGVEGSYAYMVDPKGMMLYHPTVEKIGNKVENAAVTQIVEDIAAGKKVDNGYVIYEYKGADKLAGYAFTKSGDIIVVTADYDTFMQIDYDKLIGEIYVEGVEGSYAYMVSPDGTMLYHTDKSKIGNPVENAAVKNIVTKLQAGEKVSNGATVYNYKGEKKLAGYAFTAKGNIIIVTGDYKLFIEPVTKLRGKLIAIGIALCAIFVVIGIVFVSGLLKALENVIPSIQNTAKLVFKADPKADKLCNRKDEIGLIAREIKTMQENLRHIVGNIAEATSNIDVNVDNLTGISGDVNNMCEDNFHTTESLAASMEETSASTMVISENIDQIQSEAKNIEQQTINGADASVEVMNRASKLRETTETATQNTLGIYTNVKDKATVAIRAAEAVNKINELTQTVMEISSQTSLLALNASIEAARAGEAGRGFAVVASEISRLAEQTAGAVSDINLIVDEVNESVGNMTECIRESVDFLENTVIADYENFGKISVQYQNDADTFRNAMDTIKAGIINLNDNLSTIMESISEISNTMNDATNGVSNITGKTSDMVTQTTQTANKAGECKDYVAELNAMVARFTID